MGNFKSMEMFRTAINDLNLHDLGFQGDIYTWMNKSKHWLAIMKRLDRFLCNSTFFRSFWICVSLSFGLVFV